MSNSCIKLGNVSPNQFVDYCMTKSKYYNYYSKLEKDYIDTLNIRKKVFSPPIIEQLIMCNTVRYHKDCDVELNHFESILWVLHCNTHFVQVRNNPPIELKVGDLIYLQSWKQHRLGRKNNDADACLLYNWDIFNLPFNDYYGNINKTREYVITDIVKLKESFNVSVE